MTILQALLKNYLPVAVAKTARDPVAARRARFVRSLTEQLELIGNPQLTRTRKQKQEDGTRVPVQRPVRSWIKDDNTLVPKFGITPLQLSPGKAGLLLGKASNAKDVLTKLLQATETGELDGLLETAANARVSKRKKLKAA